MFFEKATRIFFATDIHASDRCFRKFLNAGKVYDAHCLILGGDITGKRIVPIVQDGNGGWRADFAGVRHSFSDRSEVDAFSKEVRDAGAYPYPTDPDEMREWSNDQSLVDAAFRAIVVREMGRWMEIAEQRLDGQGRLCVINGGNDDYLEIDAVLRACPAVRMPEGEVIDLDDHHQMVSCGFANMTPWHCPRDIPEDELKSKLETVIQKLDRVENSVFNFHCPPYNSGLDTAAQLDETMKPVSIGGHMMMEPVGSTAVREAIEEYQPLLGLHGHIHESKAAKKLGRTLCINPGSEYPEGVLRGAVVDLGKDKVKSYVLTAG